MNLHRMVCRKKVVKPAVPELVLADTTAVKAKYFSPFNSTAKVKESAEEIIMEEGKYFG